MNYTQINSWEDLQRAKRITKKKILRQEKIIERKLKNYKKYINIATVTEDVTGLSLNSLSFINLSFLKNLIVSFVFRKKVLVPLIGGIISSFLISKLFRK